MYRVLGELRVKKGRRLARGSFTDLAWLNEKDQARLMELGKVNLVKPPPLAILPGWSKRAERFKPLGIVSVTDFLEADTKELAAKSGETGRAYKEASIERWKKEAKEWLVVKPRKGG